MARPRSRRPAWKLRSCKRWSFKEDDMLRHLWGTTPLSELAAKLKRKRSAVHRRARHLGLRMGVPKGYESIAEAARRTGFSFEAMRKLLEDRGVRIEIISSTGARAGGRDSKYNRYAVFSVDVDEAVKAWCSSITAEEAAPKYGIAAYTLRRWLREAGYKPTKPKAKMRYQPEEIDAVVAARRARKEKKQCRR